MATVSKSIEMFLEMQKIQLLEGDVWGHRKDLNEYYTVPSSVIENIKEMKLEGKFAEDIEARISRERKLNPKMIAYILTRETPA
jgi:rRNA maturation endonuclease Nob1